ncbi:MAG: DUF3568 family protein [Desulfobacterales bacterium]|nr:DUF3568 family protein [Desulfobacterales bacterium]
MMQNSLTDKDGLTIGLAIIGLLGYIGLLGGCAEVVVPGTMAGGGEYYRYITSNVAKETLMGDERDVIEAARNALTQMDMRIHSVTPYTDETIILASTPELEITIEIAPVTANTTKVIIDAREDHIIKKDKPTADAILAQIRYLLARKDPTEDLFSKVFVKNNCKQHIYVAVRFLTAKNEPEHWKTRGWFALAAGQKKHIANTHNRYIYFYAETRLRDQMYWGGDNYHWFEGQRFGFFKADFGNDYGDITQSFGCD